MTTQEVYKLASEMTEQQVNNVLGGWESANETESIRLYKSLVRLGDSKQLACATVIAEKINYKGVPEIYKIAHQ
jgi:hypothetical protein